MLNRYILFRVKVTLSDSVGSSATDRRAKSNYLLLGTLVHERQSHNIINKVLLIDSAYVPKIAIAVICLTRTRIARAPA